MHVEQDEGDSPGRLPSTSQSQAQRADACHLKDSNDGRQDSGEPCVSGPHVSHGRDLFRTRFSKLRTWLKIFSLHCPLASVESP